MPTIRSFLEYQRRRYEDLYADKLAALAVLPKLQPPEYNHINAARMEKHMAMIAKDLKSIAINIRDVYPEMVEEDWFFPLFGDYLRETRVEYFRWYIPLSALEHEVRILRKQRLIKADPGRVQMCGNICDASPQ